MKDDSRPEELRTLYIRTLQLLVQSMSHDLPKIGERELVEALQIFEQVTEQRLTDDMDLGYEEWKNDAKKGYNRLFTSTQDEVDEAVRTHFDVSDRNFVARQFLGFVVEPGLQYLQLFGPEEAAIRLRDLIKDGIDAVLHVDRDHTAEDAKVARHILVQRSKVRTRRIEEKKQRHWMKLNRLAAIKEAAQAVGV